MFESTYDWLRTDERLPSYRRVRTVVVVRPYENTHLDRRKEMNRKENKTEGKETDENPVSMKNTNRPRRPFPVTNSYFGARKPLLGRFV